MILLTKLSLFAVLQDIIAFLEALTRRLTQY